MNTTTATRTYKGQKATVSLTVEGRTASTSGARAAAATHVIYKIDGDWFGFLTTSKGYEAALAQAEREGRFSGVAWNVAPVAEEFAAIVEQVSTVVSQNMGL
jgi:hypothetical protein